ncbi:MAG: tetratricopeptide repeat protein, partial [Candidatus Omnitrophica bacterium]|nr:tetratricopeptide repeat protein [Candidatus Omnitrophota bacterium]
LSLQEYRNNLSIRQKGAYRIICLGESTTQNQYPPFLEEILNQRNIGIKFSVVDKGRGGIKASAILSQVESYIGEYHPDMVVAMMGINDRGGHIPYERPTLSKTMLFIRSFRTYKLARLLWLHMVTKAKEIGLYKLHGDKPLAQERESSLFNIRLEETNAQQKDNIKNEDVLKKALELNPGNDGAYLGLGSAYRDQEQFQQAEECFKKALELNPGNDEACVGLGGLYQDQGQFQQAEDTYKKALELNPGKVVSAILYGALGNIYEEMGQFTLAEECYSNANQIRLSIYNPTTASNYHKLKEILDKRKIKLVCVQYPMLNIEPLKKIFQGNIDSILFVDNEKTFKEAVKKGSYNMYFRDVFGGDFGHCTEKGNRILAENIANVILKEVFHK